MRELLKDKRNLVIILLALLFLIKIPQERWRFALWVLGGVAFSSAVDFSINRIFFGRAMLPKSAIVSGFILSGILDYHQPWFTLVVFSALAILSKYIIRFKGSHIFNPANFGLFVATLLNMPLTWKIETNALLIIIAGIYLAYALKKLSHVAGFLIFFGGLFAIAGINPLGIVSRFFVFIMLIEPKTSGYGAWRGFAFGAIAGTSAFLIHRLLPGVDYFVASLFLANLSIPILIGLMPGRE